MKYFIRETKDIRFSDIKNNKDYKYQEVYYNGLSENIKYNFYVDYKNNLQDNNFKGFNYLENGLINSSFVFNNRDFYSLVESINKFILVEQLNHINDNNKQNDDKQWILLSIIGLLVLIMQLFYIVL